MTTYRQNQLRFWSSVLTLSAGGLALYVCSHQSGRWTLANLSGVVLFGILFTQLSIGAITSVVGFLHLRCRRGNVLSDSSAGEIPEITQEVRTAIIIPIYHEDPVRVFLGIRRIWDSLVQAKRNGAFDIFVLSDSQDPNAWIEEEKQWLNLYREIHELGRIYYRRRRTAIHQKSGNVADFCRRWGKQYRYMIVLDADSIMSAKALATLVADMERNPTIGIIQTLPRQVLGQSIFARSQQFGGWIYSRMFCAGSRYWHHLTGPYWGHNAIIRVAPFMEYCALPEIPPIGPFRGRFLSHDSVEAAFMRRLGYGVWLDYDVEGSFEEGPVDVRTALNRDLRWCRGNMQHIALLSARGLFWESRIQLLLGIMAYLSAPLWCLLIVTTLGSSEGEYAWSVHHPCAVTLFGLVMMLLFLPKVLGFVLVRAAVTAKSVHLFRSVLLETLLSVLLAPIQMVSHTYAVFAALAGISTRWSGQDRNGKGGRWLDSVREFGVHTVLGLIGTYVIWWLFPSAFPWLLPVFAGLIFSIPLCHCLRSKELGALARQAGLFVIPEEAAPPPELARMDAESNAPSLAMLELEPYSSHRGILQAVLDPYVNATHLALLRARAETPENQSGSLGERLLINGPDLFSAQEEMLVLNNAQLLRDLHRRVWTARSGEVASWWLDGLRLFNEEKAMSVRRQNT